MISVLFTRIHYLVFNSCGSSDSTPIVHFHKKRKLLPSNFFRAQIFHVHMHAPRRRGHVLRRASLSRSNPRARTSSQDLSNHATSSLCFSSSSVPSLGIPAPTPTRGWGAVQYPSIQQLALLFVLNSQTVANSESGKNVRDVSVELDMLIAQSTCPLLGIYDTGSTIRDVRYGIYAIGSTIGSTARDVPRTYTHRR